MLYGFYANHFCRKKSYQCLNPYFFGKCSTANMRQQELPCVFGVLILIFLENALRQSLARCSSVESSSLNPYFFGKCSTAHVANNLLLTLLSSLNPYFFGKCSTAADVKIHYFGKFES